jgi:4-amino-4-deoxy-L-arabinose transferase-like glycosyltransferase
MPVTTTPSAEPRTDAAVVARPLPQRLWSSDLARLALLVLVAAFLLRLPAFFVDVFNSDETYLATQAQVIQDGGSLYEEAADRKPPLVPYIYAAGFELFGTNELWSVRVLAIFAAALTSMLVAVEARRRYGRKAAWTAGLLCVFALIAFAPQDGQAANFEIFMLPAMTASIVLARRGKMVAAGAAVAVATLAKQTGALTMLPVLYLAWKARGRKGIAESVGGFALPLAVAALALGAGQLFYWTVLGNGSYVSVETLSAYVLGQFALMTFGWIGCNLPIVWKLPAAWRARRMPSRDGATDLDLWIWLATAVVAVMVGLRFFGHYYLQMIPPLCLLTAGALARGSRRIANATIAFAAAFAIAFSAAGYFMRPFGPEPPYETVSRYIAEHTTPGQRVLVWGNVPEIYWASGVLPATRFPATNSFIAGNHPGRPPEDAAPEESDPQLWDWFFEDLAAHPPRYIVDTAPARIRGAEWTPIDRFPRLEAMVHERYHFVRTIDDIDIYERD